MDSYWLVNIAAAYKLQPGVEVFGRVENLLDEHYQDVFGFNATPGITAFAGVGEGKATTVFTGAIGLRRA